MLTSRAQDLLTTLVLPVLVWASIRSRRGSLRAHILWLGLLFYLLYSYGLYLIGWEQNRCFLVYTATVTLSGAALVDGLLRVDVHTVQPLLRSHHLKSMGIFLTTIGLAFAGLWLTDVLPMVFGGRQPQHLGPGGTPYAVYIEAAYDEDGLTCDILKAAHHGRESGYSESAVNAMSPSFVVCSVGKKPSTDASDEYRSHGAKVRSTRYHGTITVQIWADGEIWIENAGGERIDTIAPLAA